MKRDSGIRRAIGVRCCLVAVAFAFIWLPAVKAGTTKYAVTVLNIPGTARAMNASGQILGRVVEEGGAYAYVYQNGSVQRIPNLPDQPDGLSLTYNLPTAINNAGQVTGYCYDSGNQVFIGYLLNPDGSLIDFYPLTKSTFCPAMDLNNNGTVVGQAGGHGLRGWVYKNGQLSYLGQFNGFQLDDAFCVNDADQVVAGYPYMFQTGITLKYFGEKLVLITGNQVKSLGMTGNYGNNQATAINNKSQIVGRLDFNGDAFFYFDAYLHKIGSWWPQAINNAGIIVGQIGNEEVPVLPTPVNTPAMIYSGNRLDKLDDLIDPNSGFSIYNAVAITDSGVILATCARKTAPNTYLNCVLTPVGL